MATFRKSKIVTTDDSNNFENLEIPDVITEDDRKERMFAVIRKLDEGERAIVALYLEGMSYMEISEIIGISENYVGVRLNRIKDKIKKLLNV